MFKKFLSIAVAGMLAAFLCSPLWAENANSFEEWYLLASIGPEEGDAPQAAAPQDVCPFTAACFDLAGLGSPCDVVGFPGGEVCNYQDPAKNCPPVLCTKVYPFEVNAIHVLLSNCDPAQSCLVIITPGIRQADFTSPACPKPGNLICTGPAVQIIIPPNTFCKEYVIPLAESCCVDTTYFACLNFSFPTHCNGIQICHDLTCDPCCSYWDQMVGSFVDLCPTALPGNLAIWTDGFLSCQSVCLPPPPDTGKNHFKTWRIQPVPFTITVALEDQFMKDSNVRLDGIEFLSNPVRKIVFDPLGIPDTFNITDPDAHLNWYKAVGKRTKLKVAYQNQFESTSVLIDSLKYLLVPAQKLPHPAPESLDHYKCYRICNPTLFNKAVLLDDQFDLTQEQITSLSATYFCTPVIKNTEPRYDSITHYVAYSITPGSTTNESRTTIDQFGQHPVQALFSQYLLVPTEKLGVLCDAIPGDANADLALSLADVISIKNYIFNTPGCLPLPLCWLSGKICRGDTDGNGVVSLADVIRLVNYIFAKPCAPGVPGTPPCCWKPLPAPGSTCCLPVPFCDPGCP